MRTKGSAIAVSYNNVSRMLLQLNTTNSDVGELKTHSRITTIELDVASTNITSVQTQVANLQAQVASLLKEREKRGREEEREDGGRGANCCYEQNIAIEKCLVWSIRYSIQDTSLAYLAYHH